MNKIISVFITDTSIPIINLNPLPTITVYNAVDNSIIYQNAAMIEVGGGFYKYSFDDIVDMQYLFTVDAGDSLPDNERWYYGNYSRTTDSLPATMAKTVWEYDVTSESFPTNSFGNIIKLMETSTSLSLNVLSLLLKYQTNRTKLDSVAKTLTIYDNDGVTPIKIFKLYDQNGVLNIENVFDRKPQ